MSTTYQHPGDAWTQLDGERLFCDGCWPDRRDTVLRQGDWDDDAPTAFVRRVTRVVYIVPWAEDRCEACGVVAAKQHTEEPCA